MTGNAIYKYWMKLIVQITHQPLTTEISFLHVNVKVTAGFMCAPLMCPKVSMIAHTMKAMTSPAWVGLTVNTSEYSTILVVRNINRNMEQRISTRTSLQNKGSRRSRNPTESFIFLLIIIFIFNALIYRCKSLLVNFSILILYVWEESILYMLLHIWKILIKFLYICIHKGFNAWTNKFFLIYFFYKLYNWLNLALEILHTGISSFNKH